MTNSSPPKRATVSEGFFDKQTASAAPSAADRVDDEIESLPEQFLWMPFFIAFLGATYLLSMATGMRMVFSPPPVVIAFESFAHADVCPWARRPVLLPAVCTLAAAAGVAALTIYGPAITSTLLAMLFGVVMLRATRLHAIPALHRAPAASHDARRLAFPARGRHGQHAFDSVFLRLREIVGKWTPCRNDERSPMKLTFLLAGVR